MGLREREGGGQSQATNKKTKKQINFGTLTRSTNKAKKYTYLCASENANEELALGLFDGVLRLYEHLQRVEVVHSISLTQSTMASEWLRPTCDSAWKLRSGNTGTASAPDLVDKCLELSFQPLEKNTHHARDLGTALVLAFILMYVCVRVYVHACCYL